MKKNCAIFALGAALCFATACGKNADNSAGQPSGTSSPDNSSAMNSQPANQVPAPVPLKPIVVPAGTTIPVILSTTLNSRTNNAGDEFSGSVAASVLVEGEEAIPKNAAVSGTVVNAKAQGSIKGEAVMTIRLNRITVRGKSYQIASGAYTATEKGKGKRSAVMTGGGAVAGALIGGLAGGGKGAAIGAGVGGGGGLAASAGTGGKNVTLPAESRINFRLAEALTIDR